MVSVLVYGARYLSVVWTSQMASQEMYGHNILTHHLFGIYYMHISVSIVLHRDRRYFIIKFNSF